MPYVKKKLAECECSVGLSAVYEYSDLLKCWRCANCSRLVRKFTWDHKVLIGLEGKGFPSHNLLGIHTHFIKVPDGAY